MNYSGLKEDKRLIEAVPTARQIAYESMEFFCFIHFTVNTFTGREWGDGTEPESIFNPTELDAKQWAKTAAEGGMKGLILTCYCFIHKSKQGLLAILHGGALKRLEHKDIQYYYDHMDQMIATIKTPMDKYTAFQKKIAGTIQKIGGEGRIHGCITDINFFNHVYVNPIDLTVTAYWASDVVLKVVYPNIPSLLKGQCP